MGRWGYQVKKPSNIRYLREKVNKRVTMTTMKLTLRYDDTQSIDIRTCSLNCTTKLRVMISVLHDVTLQ